jgi:hypothetical protein
MRLNIVFIGNLRQQTLVIGTCGGLTIFITTHSKFKLLQSGDKLRPGSVLDKVVNLGVEVGLGHGVWLRRGNAREAKPKAKKRFFLRAQA